FVRDLPPESVRGRVPGALRHHPPAGVTAIPTRAAAPATRETPWNSDIVYDDGAAAAANPGRGISDDGPSLYRGMLVRHKQYGEGQLLRWDGSGANLKLHLRFPGVGDKTILARFCEPL